MSEGATQAPARPFWERMEERRAGLGWTKMRLYKEVRAKLIEMADGDGEPGFSRMTLDRLKTQHTPPLPATVNAIADVLGIPMAEAHTLAGILENAEMATLPNGIPGLAMHAVDDDDEELERLLAQLPPEHRELLEAVRQEERERLERAHRQAVAEYEQAQRKWLDLVRKRVNSNE